MGEAVWVSSALQVAAGAGAGAIAYKAWGYRDRPCGFPLLFMSVASSVAAVSWGVAALFEGTAVEYFLTLLGHHMGLAISVSAMYLAIEYTGEARMRNRRTLAAVGTLLAADFVFLFTDPFHRLYTGTGAVSAGVYPDGHLSYFRLIYATGFGFAGFVVFVNYMRGARGVLRRQIAPIAVGGVVALGATMVEVFGLVYAPRFNFMTVSIVMACGVILWSMFEADFLEVAPIARKTLVEGMDDAVLALDHEGRVIDTNSRACELFGIDGNVIGRDVEVVLSDHPGLAEEVEGYRNVEKEVTVEREGDGDVERRHYVVNVSPVSRRREASNGPQPYPGEREFGTVVVVRDVTDRERRKRALERKSRRLDQFADFISHDLRNSLHVASMNARLARETEDTDRLDDIEESISRMDSMITNLRKVTRVDREGVDVEEVDLREVAQSVWSSIDSRGATLEVVDSGTVVADADHLPHIFENLFRNSVEHGAPGAPETDGGSSVEGDVEVQEEGDAWPTSVEGDEGNEDVKGRTTETRAGRGVRVTVGFLDDRDGEEDGFYVEDDGKGIPEEDRDEVLKHGYTTSEDGTGFGLSIVREIAEAHGWGVVVTEGVTGGARFEFVGAVVERDGYG